MDKEFYGNDAPNQKGCKYQGEDSEILINRLFYGWTEFIDDRGDHKKPHGSSQ